MSEAQSMGKVSPLAQPQGLYEQDFYAWVVEQVATLRSGQMQRLDMGRSQRRAVKSALTIILIHLLEYRYQAERRTNSWRATIREHLQRVRDELADSPSLRPYIEQILDAREAAADESGLPIATFPTVCPFTLEQALDRNFLPE
jgi:hypothetical protein